MTDNTTNGQQSRDAATITAEVIKKNGLDVAQAIRDLAKRAREEGEAMAQFAEQEADAIVQSSSQAAARISGYIDRCTAARTSVEGHKNLLKDLPEIDPSNVLRSAAQSQASPYHGIQGAQSLTAVEQALGTLLLGAKQK